jgi:hypothetical protein
VYSQWGEELVLTLPQGLTPDDNADWLHGDISRGVAEGLLQANGMTEGLFLIRRSTSVEGAYVLSMYVNIAEG